MAYDEGLAERLRDISDAHPSIRERKMFGGPAFLCNGNMAFGIAHVVALPPRASKKHAAKAPTKKTASKKAAGKRP